MLDRDPLRQTCRPENAAAFRHEPVVVILITVRISPSGFEIFQDISTRQFGGKPGGETPAPAEDGSGRKTTSNHFAKCHGFTGIGLVRVRRVRLALSQSVRVVHIRIFDPDGIKPLWVKDPSGSSGSSVSNRVRVNKKAETPGA